MNTYTQCNNIDHAIELSAEEYSKGFTYFSGRLGDLTFKIRMNKDHAMNDNNNDYSTHILSLVNNNCPRIEYQDMNGKCVNEYSVMGLDQDEVMDKVYNWLDELSFMFN